MATIETIPSIGFTRGVIVRRRGATTTWPNMSVIRGLGATTAVIHIEGEGGGTVGLREYPTADLVQIVGND